MNFKTDIVDFCLDMKHAGNKLRGVYALNVDYRAYERARESFK